MYSAIVFLPLVSALLVGVFGRFLGNRASRAARQRAAAGRRGALMGRVLQCRHRRQTARIAILPWMTSGDLEAAWSCASTR
jgi:hypothetical protein